MRLMSVQVRSTMRLMPLRLPLLRGSRGSRCVAANGGGSGSSGEKKEAGSKRQRLRVVTLWWGCRIAGPCRSVSPMSAAFGFVGPHATSTAKSSATSLPRRSAAHRQPHRHHQSYARRTVRTPAAAASPDARPDGPPSPSQPRPGAAIHSSEDGNVSLQSAVAQWQAAGLSVGIFNRTSGLTTNLPPVPPTRPPPLPMGTIPSDSPNRTVYRVKPHPNLHGPVPAGRGRPGATSSRWTSLGTSYTS
ncbi:unnamed protein product [Vitrella brassicaformis CCMP3155]|uniref:Uncharacterized protein n=1 Tax=Vitrella brassicaformis (strain CCMP3155) TaxID=1169540 RepID=A0A0G4GHM8_VITBC|nr:unnamed protein product [Vitrella brassicaformis CCMP3155]|eukprot:CEM29199.1 unnamed protein product [Vitrella brassicaformis CCMP3155]